MPSIVKENKVKRQKSVLSLYKPTEGSDNPDISSFQLFCEDVVAGRA